MSGEPEKRKNDWVEEIEVTGNELVDRVKELIQQGNIRRLIIRRGDGSVLMEVPLTGAVAVGGALTLFNPILAGLGAMAALIAKLKIEVVRESTETESTEEAPAKPTKTTTGGKKRIEIISEDE